MIGFTGILAFLAVAATPSDPSGFAWAADETKDVHRESFLHMSVWVRDLRENYVPFGDVSCARKQDAFGGFGGGDLGAQLAYA